MIWLLLAAVLILAIGLFIALVVLVGAALYLVRSRGEEADGPVPDCDDLMDIADVVSDDHAAALAAVDDHFAEDYEPVSLEGFSPLEAETLQRNYLPMTDDERFRLDMAWRSIVEGADR